MAHEVNLLDQVRFASPCGVPWEAMTGDDRSRVCGKCRRNVYNLSGMIPLEAEQLLMAREGPACDRVYRRVDGSVITRDCPRGIRRARLAVVGVIGVAALFLFAAEQYGNYVRIRNTETYDMTSLEPFVRFRPAPSSVYGATPGMAPYVFGQPTFSRHRPYVVQPNPSSGFPALPSAISTYSVSSRYPSLPAAAIWNWCYRVPQSSMQQQLAAAMQQLSQKYPGTYGFALAPASQPSKVESAWKAFEGAMKLLSLLKPGEGVGQSKSALATSQPMYAGENLMP